MSTQVPAVFATATTTRRPPAAWPPLALAVVCAAAYAIFFVMPYYVNDLDRYPLAEVAGGMHDPKDLWPRNGSGLAFVFTFGGLLTLALAPFGTVIAVGWAAINVALGRPSRDGLTVAISALAAAIGIVTLVWLASPFASALFRWWLD